MSDTTCLLKKQIKTTVSALELKRQLKVSYNTAWNNQHKFFSQKQVFRAGMSLVEKPDSFSH